MGIGTGSSKFVSPGSEFDAARRDAVTLARLRGELDMLRDLHMTLPRDSFRRVDTELLGRALDRLGEAQDQLDRAVGRLAR